MTKCLQAHEFPEFVQNYINATKGCMKSSSDNLYLYTHKHEWENYSNSSWTQEPWVDDSNTFYLPSQYIAPLEQPYQHYSLLPLQENIDFEDSMMRTVQEYEASVQVLTSEYKSIAKQIDQLVNTFNE